MAIFLYQIGIFIAIIFAGTYGRSSRNVAVILIMIFTILQVYAFPLMFIQFLTIIFAYIVSKYFSSNNNIGEKQEKYISPKKTIELKNKARKYNEKKDLSEEEKEKLLKEIEQRLEKGIEKDVFSEGRRY